MSHETLNIHACCVLLGDAGVLIRGAPGAGKSSLARRLVSARHLAGGFAALVADDRVIVACHHGRLVARPHPMLAGLSEHRGLGIRPTPHEAAAVLRLAIDLTHDPAPRLPAAADLETMILGVRVPRLTGRASEGAALVEAALPWQ